MNDRMTTEQAAKYVGLTANTLSTWRVTRAREIPYLKVGGRVFYRRSDLDAFLDSCLVQPGAQKAAA